MSTFKSKRGKSKREESKAASPKMEESRAGPSRREEKSSSKSLSSASASRSSSNHSPLPEDEKQRYDKKEKLLFSYYERKEGWMKKVEETDVQARAQFLKLEKLEDELNKVTKQIKDMKQKGASKSEIDKLVTTQIGLIQRLQKGNEKNDKILSKHVTYVGRVEDLNDKINPLTHELNTIALKNLQETLNRVRSKFK
jgi:uncharacterized protein (UPF0335 family)